MTTRLGAGKCRHIEVEWLWLQQAINEKKLTTKYVPTESNIADIAIKGVDERQNMENDEPDGNELGCWDGVSCAAANGENHRGVES